MATEVEQLAEQARQVLDSPAFKQAFYPMQVAVIDEIARTHPGETELLAGLALKLQCMRHFEDELMDCINSMLIEKHPEHFSQSLQ